MDYSEHNQKLVAALYQKYLTRSVQLEEKLTEAELRIEELKSSQKCSTCPNVEDGAGDTEANS